MEKKGQGALEYLLLIGGAVLIAVIVIAVVTGLANTTGTQINAGTQCVTFGCENCKKAAAGTCAGFTSAGVRLFISTGAAATCTAAEATNFAVCKSA